MSTRKQKLELTWIGKENRPKLEPRILVEDPQKSYHALHRVGRKDLFDNKLIFGDNLLALKALEQDYAGKVKCVYIDPPYNTGSAFSHYDDGLEHSLWLSLIRERLKIIWNLLDSKDGSLWVSIDDSEMPYLRVLLDEICGRDSFVASNIWQKRYSRENREAIGDAHEYVLVYARDIATFKKKRNKLPLGEKQKKVYKNPNKDPRGLWRAVSFSAQGFRPNQMYEIESPETGKIFTPPEGSCWKVIRERYEELLADDRIYFGKDGNAMPQRKQFLSQIEGMAPWTWWPHEEVGHTDESKREMHALYGAKDSFPTPKPERLIQRVLHIATNPGDLVLDSFLGSGTTAAVAHKMGRRWIGIELGEHCHTHCIPRLKKVIDGEDPGGITKAVDWKGGGGFRYYKLAPSLLEKDKWDNWVISKDYNAAMLAEAVCKLEGFTYAPSDSLYWQHGHSTEQDFIYVTTASLKHEQLQQLSDEVGPERSLLVVCTSFRGSKEGYANLTVKKIPKAVLSRCEWGKDDYSLRVENLPDAPPKPGQLGLFDGEEDAE
ncbi:site-specific DNA-methyltransferase [Allochromatium palmeri]|uniref:site-specific DNA-methyltransferase (adenine-specific) n=1 Tax=Allochromatium palmeri TaxID=231048 RepID=A0A6N8EFG7_9GAMM|nr:site-specific DNA-methyltransferase [Allochromatium palmeri]MTW21084.1 site-specific DNA-methyltransferase [Allochromatium palmeri]